MKSVCLLALLLSMVGCAPVPPPPSRYFGLTQAQLAAKIGYPLRVFILPASAKGGPGILIWVYYQRSSSGEVEERQFTFDASPLKVNSMSPDFVPSRLLSLDDARDFQLIYRYNAAHGR